MVQQGFYTDPPSRRMAYDEDGTVMLRIIDNVPSVLSLGSMQAFNSENYSETFDAAPGPASYVTLIFPELRDVTHAYRNMITGANSVSSSTSPWYVSSNTTNGVDGDWVESNSFTGIVEPTTPNYRTKIGVVGAAGVKAIKWYADGGGGFANRHYSQWHVYGYKTAGETPHRIDFCNSAGDELIQDFDYGDQPRNSTRIWRPTETWNQSSALYLRNRSTTKVAQTVTVTMETLAGDMFSFTTLSKDNITYGSSVTYTTIQPQQIVGPIYVKHSPSISAALTVKAGRLQVVVGTWV